MNVLEQIQHNRFQTWIAVYVFILFFVFLGLGVDFFVFNTGLPLFGFAAFGVGSLSSYMAYHSGDKLILKSTGARTLELTDPQQQQWKNVVEEMSIASGIPVPAMYLIDDPDPNAFATGNAPEHASIAVTRGLLETLNRDELQAVAAHEMSHIKNFDIRLMMMIAALVGSVALLSDWARRGLFYQNRSSNRRQSQGGLPPLVFIIWLVTMVLAPVISQLMAMFVSRGREYLADATGAHLTRNPKALADALRKIEGAVDPTRSIRNGTAHLCIVDPKGRLLGFQEGLTADLFATHPPIHKRIEALQQMAYNA